MKRFTAVLVASIALVAVGCSSGAETAAPLAEKQARANNEVCRSGWLVRTGAEPDSTYTGCSGGDQ